MGYCSELSHVPTNHHPARPFRPEARPHLPTPEARGQNAHSHLWAANQHRLRTWLYAGHVGAQRGSHWWTGDLRRFTHRYIDRTYKENYRGELIIKNLGMFGLLYRWTYSSVDLWTAGAVIESTPRIFKCQPTNWTAEPCSDSSFTKEKHIPPKKQKIPKVYCIISHMCV